MEQLCNHYGAGIPGCEHVDKCWQQQQGEACSIDALTDRFVKVDRAAVAKPNTRNAARYQDLQVLQDQTALALSKVFSRHRAITEQG